MGAPPNLVMAIGSQPTEINVNFSLTTTQTTGSVVAGNIEAFGPLSPPQPVVTVPAVEVWHITDLYVLGGPVAADGQVLLLINGYIQNIAPKLSSLNLNLLTRFRLPYSIPLAPNTTWSTSLYLLQTPTVNATQLLTIKVQKAPFTGG